MVHSRMEIKKKVLTENTKTNIKLICLLHIEVRKTFKYEKVKIYQLILLNIIKIKLIINKSISIIKTNIKLAILLLLHKTQ